MINSEYDFKLNEKLVQEKWNNLSVFRTNYNQLQNPYYMLETIYYPSGKLHMGHCRVFTIGDIIARFKMMQGYNLIHPMGADAFGLPAENAAIENGIHPAQWTYENVDIMNSQIKALGNSHDWDLTITTCDPEYYKHEQKMFIDFYNNDIAYQKESVVNWDPVDQTVLANEQVENGRGWRSGALIEQRTLKQWSLKTSKYSEELLNAIPDLNWPEKIKKTQTNWIGKSEGADIDFKIVVDKSSTYVDSKGSNITVFSTRPETLSGATFVAIAPDHSLALTLAEGISEIKDFIEQCKKESIKTEDLDKKEKLGIFTGLYCINPLEDKIIPVWIANFVLSNYGTGAIFGCPAHDERDFEFAKKYNLDIIDLEGNKIDTFSEYPKIPFNELPREIKDICGKPKPKYKLRDWGISRQRYWGCPIPMVYCDKCGVVPEKEENLPITLPKDVVFDGKGNPLANHPTWKHCKCPSCGIDAIRETDTFDTFFESSWYFLRYLSPKNDQYAFDKQNAKKGMPVTAYVCGAEHAVSHLLYSRFFMLALRDCGYFKDCDISMEPFKTLIVQGTVCHKTYKTISGKWVYPKDVIKQDGKFYHQETNEEVIEGDSIKMSKSKKNIVDPDQILANYGADAMRLFISSDTPIDKDFEWDQSGIEAICKYLNKIHRLYSNFTTSYDISKMYSNDSTNEKQIISFLHKTVDVYESHIERFEFNVAIAKIRELTNFIEDIDRKNPDNHYAMLQSLQFLCRMLNPFVPHLADKLWQILGNNSILAKEKWIPANKDLIVESEVTIAIQVNGKLKGTILIHKDATEEECTTKAMQSSDLVHKHLNDKVIKKVIFVKNKIVNFVL